MSAFDIGEAIEVLRATPGTMRELLGGLSSVWLDSPTDRSSWNANDIVGHLIAGDETDWIPRARIMLEHGTSQPFAAFDRDAQSRAPGRSTEQMLEHFAAVRAQNISALEGLIVDASSLDARGIHPDFGDVRLGDMLSAWVVHDLSHIAQAAETMAKRYVGAVGPWRRYLPVLDREELPSS